MKKRKTGRHIKLFSRFALLKFKVWAPNVKFVLGGCSWAKAEGIFAYMHGEGMHSESIGFKVYIQQLKQADNEFYMSNAYLWERRKRQKEKKVGNDLWSICISSSLSLCIAIRKVSFGKPHEAGKNAMLSTNAITSWKQ
jgi:hypothetical protein